MGSGEEYQFVAWARSGLGTLLAGAPASVQLQLSGAPSVTRSVAAYGPGDVTGLDARAVARTIPPAGATDFEPNLFAAAELAHPGIPWLVSPPADNHGRITPWITLVVVEDKLGIALAAGASGIQVLSISLPAVVGDELPDLTQAWAWAHGQTIGAIGASIGGAPFTQSNGAASGRLLAARRLMADTSYIACVVPVFAAGVVAALGGAPRSGLAWSRGETEIQLPVYFAWRFATGPGGDFASLVKRIQPAALDTSLGHRTVDISAPGWAMPTTTAAELEVTGALRSSTWTPPPPPPAAVALGTAIAQQIDTAANPTSTTAPALPPPFYGAAATQQRTTSAAPTWQRQLNADIAQRVAAGLGAEVVRSRLDTLVDAAWRAAGDAERANQLIRHAEVAAEVTQTLAQKHIAAIVDDGEVLAVARPLLPRMPGQPRILSRALQHSVAAPPAAGPTVAAMIRGSAMPDVALSAALRRMGRAHGPIARATSTPAAVVRTGAVLAAVNAQAIVPVPAPTLAAGAAGFDAISEDQHELPRLHLATVEAVATASTSWQTSRRATSRTRKASLPPAEVPWTPPLLSLILDPLGIDLAQVRAFEIASKAHQSYIVGKLEAIPDRPPPALGDSRVARPLSRLRANVEAQWTPSAGVLPLVSGRLSSGAVSASFDAIQIAPVLEQPLIEVLQALSPEHVMPGVGAMASNRAGIAATAPEFVRAFLVGANEELGRELLWRGFPGALGHTWLQTFWGRTVVGADGTPAIVPDIPPIESWPPAGAAPAPATLVLVVRADVLHRYPNALIYAVAAHWDGKHRVVGSGTPLAPVVAATLGADIALFGFDLDVATARGSDTPTGPAGWYFVIAEHPSEPRFGLAASSAGPPASWRDVAWADVQPGDLTGNYLRADGPLAARSFAGDPLRWGTDAAALAAITRRRAVRVAMHASTLLPPV